MNAAEWVKCACSIPGMILTKRHRVCDELGGRQGSWFNIKAKVSVICRNVNGNIKKKRTGHLLMINDSGDMLSLCQAARVQLSQ